MLHLLAIAHAAGVPLALDDFEAIRARVPVLCDLKPSGRYVATDLHRAGGVPQVMKMLLAHGLLHGDALTITGETVAETLRDVPAEPRADQEVIRPWGRPLYAAGPPRGAARQPRARGRGREDHRREGAADHRPGPRLRVGGGLPRGDPRPAASGRATCSSSATRGRGAAPGCGRCSRRPRPSSAPGSATRSALITDGRFSGGTYGLVVGHVAPEAAVGGPIALVEEGDPITIDADERLLALDVGEDELARRRARVDAAGARATRRACCTSTRARSRARAWAR